MIETETTKAKQEMQCKLYFAIKEFTQATGLVVRQIIIESEYVLDESDKMQGCSYLEPRALVE